MTEKATIVIIAYNQRDLLIDYINKLESWHNESHIIIVDNGSGDGLAEWLKGTAYDYIVFDEGIQGFAKVMNSVLQNFETNETVIFTQARYCLEENGVQNIISVLKDNNNIGLLGCALGQNQCQQDDSLNKEQKISYVLSIMENVCAINRKTYEKAGSFDEEMALPRNVILDYALRLIKLGYRNAVSLNAKTYDLYGEDEIEYNKLLWESDRTILKKKWKMNYFNTCFNDNLVNLIDKKKEEEFKVLEIGCDLGATLLEIESRFPNSETFGLEINDKAVEIASCLTDVRVGNIEEYNIPFDEKFDFILFGDVLEHLRNPQEVVNYCETKLKSGGCIIASIPNIMHISVMEQLVNGRFPYQDTGLLDRTHIHFFTYYEIMAMFQEAGYEVDNILLASVEVTEEQETLKHGLLALSRVGTTESFMYDTFQYIVRARKKQED